MSLELSVSVCAARWSARTSAASATPPPSAAPSAGARTCSAASAGAVDEQERAARIEMRATLARGCDGRVGRCRGVVGHVVVIVVAEAPNAAANTVTPPIARTMR